MLPLPSVEILACILRQYRTESRALTLQLHAHVARCGLQGAASIGNELVMSFTHWGDLCDAQVIFDQILCKKECSWSSLISSYLKCDRPQDALALYHQHKTNVDLACPSPHTIVAVLKTCGKLKDTLLGVEVHTMIDRFRFLQENVFVGSALLDMYVKCGSLHNAQEVFDKLSKKNVVSWTALIAGYAEQGHNEKALKYFERMQDEGVVPNAVTFICTLKACAWIGDIDKGQELHCEIERRGLLQGNRVLSSALVNMYTKCGFLSMAQYVSKCLPFRSVGLWNILITAYTEFGYGNLALECFKQLQLEGVLPDAITFVSALRACGIIGDIDEGRAMHTEIARHALLVRDLVIGNSLIDMYVKCGWLTIAQEVFSKLSTKDVVSWTTLIAGYADQGLGKEALTCFDQMQLAGFFPNDISLICGVKACGSIKAAYRGLILHAEIEKLGLLDENTFVGNIVVDMYARCGLLNTAHKTCEKLRVQNVAAWNALIAGYVQCGYGEEALNCLEDMQCKGVSRDSVTFILSLKACGSCRAISIGRQIHAEIERQGLLEADCMLANTLISMYAKCGLIDSAQGIYNKLHLQDVVSSTAMLTGYVEHGQSEEVLSCIAEQQDSGFVPDAVIFLCSLKACGRIGATLVGQKLHFEIERRGMLESDPAICNTLIYMYAKCGSFAVSRQMFDRLYIHDVVSWTMLIASYAEQERGEEALECLEEMQLEGISPNAATFVCCLKACIRIGAEFKAQEIFADIERHGLLENVDVANTVVSTYANIGSLASAQDVFDKISSRDVVSWNSLLVGYAMAGKSEDALNLFTKMLEEGVHPNLVTFVIVLSACSSTGLFLKSLSLFEAMTEVYGLNPALEHHTCVVDILGRTGQLETAQAMVMKMPFIPDDAVWATVLGACMRWGDFRSARKAFDHRSC